MERYVIIPIGPAGCGKTTYFENTVIRSGYVTHLSADKIRFKLLDYPKSGIDFNEAIEPVVWKEFDRQYKNALEGKDWIYIDNTNLTKSARYAVVVQALRKKFEIFMVYFDLSLETILKRNAKRDRNVPENVIIEQFERMQRPEEWEYDQLVIINE